MKKKYYVIGLMSGTSVDGVDLAYCSFEYKNKWSSDILYSKTVSYPDDMQERLKNCVDLPSVELLQLDHELGKWFGKQISRFISKENLTPLLIASHGHTVFHQPKRGFTYQIGNLYEIYHQVKIPVAGDFRSLDVTLGGQGAPLVPIGDSQLFSDYDFCLNLGGFSNISFDKNGKRLAFDICAVNSVLNYLAEKKGLPFDRNGETGANGRFIEALFLKLNELDYYQLKGPKSLGIEWVNEKVIPLLNNSNVKVEDQLHTYYRHIAYQIRLAIDDFIRTGSSKNMLITGGGAFNEFLISNIKNQMEDKASCVIPSEKMISYKEALIFAFLGLLRWMNKTNTLKSVTGAKYDSSGGVIVNNLIIKQNNKDFSHQRHKLKY